MTQKNINGLDSQLMNSIKTELLSEINPKTCNFENHITESTLKGKSAIRIQKLFRQRLDEVRSTKNLNSQEFSNLLQGSLPKEKVRHISNVNGLESVKMEIQTIELDTQTLNIPQKKFTKPSDLLEELKNSQDSLTEMRLLFGSEKRLKESHEETTQNFEDTVFGKSSFDDFSTRKMQELLKVDHISLLISVQEEAIKYKELSDKQYMQKMYHAKKYSFKTYQRKRKELEKWITKKKEEMKKTKKSLLETWKKTAVMIEEVNKNKLELKKTLMKHTISYSSDDNKEIISFYESCRPTLNKEFLQEANSSNKGEFSINKDTKETLKKKETNENSCGSLEEKLKELGIYTKEESKDVMQDVYDKDIEEILNFVESNNQNDRIDILTQDIHQTKITDSGNVEKLTKFIYGILINECTLPLFPFRDPEITKSRKSPQNKSNIGIPDQSQLQMMKLLALKSHDGIQTDQYYIGQYIETFFAEVCRDHKQHLISEINLSIIKSPLEMLTALQSTDPDRLIESRLPHEIDPIVSLSVYLNLEKIFSIPTLGNYTRIHNKAIFDALNEALNLIRPYGLNAEPMPWSTQGRI